MKGDTRSLDYGSMLVNGVYIGFEGVPLSSLIGPQVCTHMAVHEPLRKCKGLRGNEV